MKNSRLYLPVSHLSTLRRKPRSAAHKLADSPAQIRCHSISFLCDDIITKYKFDNRVTPATTRGSSVPPGVG